VKCRSSDNQIFAAKIVKKSQGLAQREVSICKILAQNPHKNILSMKEYFISGGDMIIIFPYINGGTLYNYLATTETHHALLSIRKIFRQILKGLEYIHTLGLIHRDIKMDNIMVNKSSFETFIIIDFGLAVFYNSVNLMEDRCGTIGYIAPEVLNNEQYDQRCDIFSLAQVFHILLTGNPMFNRKLGQV
jgi:serine/threonine protein kinase